MVLIKIEKNENSRLYLDYATPREAVTGIMTLYEQLLQQLVPNKRDLTYTVGDLLDFLDNLNEIIIMM